MSHQRSLHELALFAGAGGGILAGKLLGWRCICAVEIDDYCRRVLMQRQDDGLLEPFPIWDDVRTFDGRPWGGRVDVISGGFPCQDISQAGKGGGIDGERSGLWREFARIIRDVQPRFVFVENSPMLTGRGLGVVLGDLAEMGFDARWCVLGAHHVGAPHKRDRIWIVACHPDRQAQPIEPLYDQDVAGVSKLDVTDSERLELRLQPRGERRQDREGPTFPVHNGKTQHLANTDSTHGKRDRRSQRASEEYSDARCSEWWEVEPSVGRVADGVAHRVDRLKAIGNGQVSSVAALAWHLMGPR